MTNVTIFIVFGLISYNRYAKRWSAKTGRYSTTGWITWSQYVYTSQEQSLVSYSYRVAGVPYNGTISIPLFNGKKFVDDHPKGKEIVVFYAAKDPAFSRAHKPATHLDIIGYTVVFWLICPLALINAVSSYLYWLVNVSVHGT